VNSVTVNDLASHFDVAELDISCAQGAPRPLRLTARGALPAGHLDAGLTRAVQDELGRRGALLIRGWDATEAARAGAVCEDLLAGLAPFVTGEHPQVDGAGALYEPVKYAPEEKLLWHHENSFNAVWPRFIVFACSVPAAEGGATPIVDGRLVYESAPPDLRALLGSHGISYQRLCDGLAGRTWQQLYHTDDTAQALGKARENGEDLVFAAGGARITARRAAFLAVAHGTSWFNQLLHWHPRALPADIRDMIGDGLLPMFRNCTAGNGEEIPPDAVDEIIKIHADLEHSFRWQAGDILMIDNEIFAHARDFYRGRRLHFVRMAHGRPADDPAAEGEGR
jgi:alpha-ketoglutarate-dependent taurine dioxygenase